MKTKGLGKHDEADNMGHHSVHSRGNDDNDGSAPVTNNGIHLPKVPLTTDILRSLSGTRDPYMASKLEVRFNIRRNSIQNLGILAPNLIELKINNSILDTIRDLGTSLCNLRVLWVSCCNLKDLDGISSFLQIKELYSSFNSIADVSPCSMLEHLQVLDLEGNQVSDLKNMGFLRLCPDLRSVTLAGNPVCQEKTYRTSIRKLVPQIQYLDDLSISSKGVADHDKDDMNIIRQVIREGLPASNSNSATNKDKRESVLANLAGLSMHDLCTDAEKTLKEFEGTANGAITRSLQKQLTLISEEECRNGCSDSDDLANWSIACGNPGWAFRKLQKHRVSCPPMGDPLDGSTSKQNDTMLLAEARKKLNSQSRDSHRRSENSLISTSSKSSSTTRKPPLLQKKDRSSSEILEHKRSRNSGQLFTISRAKSETVKINKNTSNDSLAIQNLDDGHLDPHHANGNKYRNEA